MRPHRAGGEDRPMSTQEFREQSIELLEGIASAMETMAEIVAEIHEDLNRIQLTGLEVKK